jgi:hypothetical protein
MAVSGVVSCLALTVASRDRIAELRVLAAAAADRLVPAPTG